MNIIIEPITTADRPQISKLLTENWGSSLIISRGKPYDASNLPGFVAKYQDSAVGLITFQIEYSECQQLLQIAGSKIRGGSKLIHTVKCEAMQASCSRLWLVTTNDNL